MSDTDATRMGQLPVIAYMIVLVVGVMFFFSHAEPTVSGTIEAVWKTAVYVITLSAFTFLITYARAYYGRRNGNA